MAGQMIEFAANGTQVPGYLAVPEAGQGPGVVVLHAWWGLTEPFRQVCDRLAEAGFTALAPDLYRGKTTASVDEAGQFGEALDQQVEQWRGDIRAAVKYLHQYGQHGKFALLGFSLGSAYALDMSVQLADEVAAVVVFYDAYSELEFSSAKAAYLLHYAEDDTFVPTQKVQAMEHALAAAGRQASINIYPNTKHWFFEANRPDAYDAAAAALAWERTLAFLRETLR